MTDAEFLRMLVRRGGRLGFEECQRLERIAEDMSPVQVRVVEQPDRPAVERFRVDVIGPSFDYHAVGLTRANALLRVAMYWKGEETARQADLAAEKGGEASREGET